MNDLQIQPKIINGKPYIDSRIVADGFDVLHDSLVKQLQRYFPDLMSEKSTSTGGRPLTTYYLSERDVMMLPSVLKTNEKTFAFQGKLVDALIEARKQLQSPQVPTNLRDALLLAAELEEKRLLLETKVAEDAPKVAFHDSIMSSDDCITVKQMAKILGTGQNKLFEWMRDNGTLIASGPSYNTPFQRFIDQGYFEVDETTVTIKNKTHLHSQTKITPKGQKWLSKRWEESK